MFTINSILDEINELPPSRLEEVYEFVHSLNASEKKNDKTRKKILSFAGSFSEMSVGEYAEFKKHTRRTRENLFDRNVEI